MNIDHPQMPLKDQIILFAKLLAVWAICAIVYAL
jgi:hypothetical protein